MKRRVDLKIHGRVQGVFFRDSSQRKAKELNLSGFVKNEPDGTVQIIAEGEEKNLEELIEWCRAGGTEYARVDQVEIKWLELSDQFDNFIVK
ncbi:acylphosphatase [Patescibacteria group bacterium]|nr:acylphosphatase [Patescibacteria group bacterium]MBU2219857.1 acylphosphatase [Patescibacteria group bacterium]MBU2264736.1 acylphosphatase [Patescibacteria group bacterium]